MAINLGAIAVQMIREWAPLSPQMKAKRRARKAVRRNARRTKKGLPPIELTTEEVANMPETVTMVLPDGSQVQRTEPLINARSSTKSGTIGLVSLPVIQLIQEITWPWPWLEVATESAAFAQILTVALMYVTARYTKTPAAGPAF